MTERSMFSLALLVAALLGQEAAGLQNREHTSTDCPLGMPVMIAPKPDDDTDYFDGDVIVTAMDDASFMFEEGYPDKR